MKKAGKDNTFGPWPTEFRKAPVRAGGASRAVGISLHRVCGRLALSVVRYENLDAEYEAEAGDSILDADLNNGVDHTNDCGGNCACSTCKVVVVSGAEHLSPQEEDERDTLDAYGWNPDEYRLACQCILKGEGRIVLRMPDPE